MKRVLVGSVLLWGALWANRARAQEIEFGSVGHVAISAERLFGFVHTDESVSGGSASGDTISLFSNPTALIGTGYSWPRIGVDVFVSRSVSLGAAASVFNISPSSGSLSGYQLAPRVGYAGNVGPRLAIWLRGGITYEHASTDGGGGTLATQSFLALTIEAPLVILLVPHAALLIGPTLDLGLTGTVSSGGVSSNQKFTDFGIQAGLLLFI